MKQRIFDIIQIGQRDDLVSRAFDLFIVVAIFGNMVVLFLETFIVNGYSDKILKGKDEVVYE